ncbi:hypothetical protein [uncultured Microbacterium sp.]|uniref:hypothetical protein n=1 Tax=uncultured Microbacterium sp. TaxID=191216 RepID=UPI0035CBF0D2
METVDSSTIIPNGVVGVIVIVVGILIVIYRRPLTTLTMRSQKAMLPRGISRMMQRAPYPVFAVGAVGVLAIAMGAFAIANAVTAFNQISGG